MQIQLRNSGFSNRLAVIITVIVLGTIFAALPCRTAMAASVETSKLGRNIMIRLAAGEFDPLIEPTPADTAQMQSIQAYLPGREGYYILQFDRPIQAGQTDALEAMGARVFDYIPDFAFIVKMDEATREDVEFLENVRWVGVYQPAYRVAPTITGAAAAGEKTDQDEFIIVVFKGEDAWMTARQIEQLGGTVLDVAESDYGAKLKIRIDAQNLEAAANISGVKWIEPAPVWKLDNDKASEIMEVPEVRNTYDLRGTGQVVAVADSGLDRGVKDAGRYLHNDFENGSGGSRVSQIFVRAGDNGGDRFSGHGTHVAGSVLGNGDGSKHSGVAPEATLVFQALEDETSKKTPPDNLDGLPLDLNELFQQAYNAGAMIHTNSWGAKARGAYTSMSEDVDEFMWKNKNFLIFFSAGNEGIDLNQDGVVDLYSLKSPGSAKNCITVGASENDRPLLVIPPDIPDTYGNRWPADFPTDPINSDHISNRPDGMVAFSSRGPCQDGRFKPDIVAPGTNIYSAKSSLLPGSGRSTVMSGTSMSTPLAAGAATLARQFYVDKEKITPSAALIKATLLNGAKDISPGQYRRGYQEIPDPPRPNNVAGWGRLDLQNAIFPVSPRVVRYYDEKSGLTTGKSNRYKITVGDAGEPLRANLVWSDYRGSPAAKMNLVNDLDLSITGPSGKVYYPDAARQSSWTQSETILYDDGAAENSYQGGVDRVGVRFTPSSYPARLEDAFLNLGSKIYPNTFNCYVYDGSESEGPKNLLATAPTKIYKDGWHTINFSRASPSPPTIDSGDFFVVIELNSDLQWFYDDTNPDGRSWDYSYGTWAKWPDDDYMFRAFVKTNEQIIDEGSAEEYIFDDGTAEDVVEWGPALGQFTPSSYPAKLLKARYHVTSTSYPQTFTYYVYDGISSPKTVLASGQTTVQKNGWHTVDFTSSSLTIDSGYFFVGFEYHADGPDIRIQTDLTDPQDLTTWFWDIRKPGWGLRKLLDVMIRPVIATRGATFDRTNNVVGIEIADPATGSYKIDIKGFNVPQGPQPYALVVSGGSLSELNPTIPQDPPDNLSASAVSTTRIDLSWSYNSAYESGFKIERKIFGGSYSQIATVGADFTNYSDTGLNPSTTYTYRVRAYNADEDSNYSNEDSATTLSASPNPPGNLSATARSATRIDLSWSDKSNNESGFMIERKASSGSYSQIAKVGANVTSYKNTGLSASTTYTYRVRAYNSAGDSNYSNAASATTPSAGGGGSQDDVENFVTRFYWECLGRKPDQTGLNDWTNGLIDGAHTGADVARHFINSTEFQGKNYSDEEYLEILYDAFFDRPPDPVGWNFWLGELKAGKSRGYVLDGFLRSQEFYDLCWKYGIFPHKAAAFVYRFYDECLGRKPDRKGLEDWTKGLLDGVHTGADVARHFIHSTEFQGKNFSDEEYIEILYWAFFNRAPTPAGKNYWLGELMAGKSRDWVLDGFLKSDEFRKLCEDYGITPY